MKRLFEIFVCKNILMLALILSFSSVFGQLANELNDLIESKEKDYQEIEKVFYPLMHEKSILLDFIEASSKTSYFEGVAFANNQLGIDHRNLAEYPEALIYHNKALLASEECENIDFKIMSLNMLGVVYRRMEEVRIALDLHKQALELAEGSGLNSQNVLKGIAIARNSIGNLYVTLRQHELAEVEFLASLEIEELLNNRLGLAINYQNLGSIYEERGDFDTALEKYQQSLAYNQEIDSEIGKVICLNSIGQIYLKQGLVDEALILIEPTIAIAEEIGDKYYLIMAKTNMGWALLNKGLLIQSENYLKEVISVSVERNIQFYLAQSYKLLSDLMAQKKDYQSALMYNKLYVENEEKYLNERNQQYMADLILRYDSEKKKNQIDILEKENELVNVNLDNNRKVFTATIVCLILLSILLFIIFRQNKLRNEKEFLALEQRMLRSQMNPHFIFNSLNSIKLFIINNEKDKAAFYLNKFSKLIRTILSTSKEKDITLDEEINTMNLYMNIENIRFSNHIDYKVQIDEGVDVKGIRVPSLILQPFLENAIWHGLSAKEGSKIVSLFVYRYSETQICIEITDNGIGRKQSQENRSMKKHKNQSIGIDLTRERLHNYFDKNPTSHSMEIVDLFDKAHKPSGTKVILKIPYIDLT